MNKMPVEPLEALIIEDDLYIAKFFQFLLRQEGVEAEVVVNGRQTRQLLKTQTPQIILLDLMLPDMHGTQILKMIRDDPRFQASWVIVVTADGSFVSNYSQEGVDFCLIKPIDAIDMRRLIGRLKQQKRKAVDVNYSELSTDRPSLKTDTS
jgi:DNA-binding response OmpR family regulator